MGVRIGVSVALPSFIEEAGELNSGFCDVRKVLGACVLVAVGETTPEPVAAKSFPMRATKL